MAKMTVAYQIGNKLYLNLTNRCDNDCEFCLRRGMQGLEGHELWLEREPDFHETIAAIQEHGNPADFEEVVFVGFGEPTYRFDLIKEVAAWLKQAGARVRLDTNGHGNLIQERDITPELAGLIDTISISLNATTAKEYDELCHSIYGEESYDAMLDFAAKAKTYVPRVILTIVNYGGVDLEKAREITEAIGVELRVREYIEH